MHKDKNEGQVTLVAMAMINWGHIQKKKKKKKKKKNHALLSPMLWFLKFKVARASF